MSDRIHELIEGIRNKSISLQGRLSEENSKNQELQSEVGSLNDKLTSKQEEIEGLKLKVSELETRLEAKVEQEVVVSDGTNVSKEQIDELVKEIDYCIEQLKK